MNPNLPNMERPFSNLDDDALSSLSSDSSQDSAPDDLIILSQAVAPSQDAIDDSCDLTHASTPPTRKHKSVSSDREDKVIATAVRKRITPSPAPSIPEDTVRSQRGRTSAHRRRNSTGRLLQLQARGSAKIYKINEDRLVNTSDLFKYKLFVETQPARPSKDDDLESNDLTAYTEESTTVDPRYPLIVLEVDSEALFLYCLWKMAPDRLSLYIDSTIPRPSTEFVIYLYQAFLLAIELKDSDFLTNLVTFILKDPAGEPSEYAITWAYENTETGSMLRDFVVDCTLTWADEELEEWKIVAQGVPKEFLVDVTCRLMELGIKKKYGLVKTDVACRFIFPMGWPIEDLKKAAKAVGVELNCAAMEFNEGR